MSENIPFRRQMSFEFIPWLRLCGKQTKELLQRHEDDGRIDLMTGWIEVSGTDTVKAATPPVFFSFLFSFFLLPPTLAQMQCLTAHDKPSACVPVPAALCASPGDNSRFRRSPPSGFFIMPRVAKKVQGPVLQCKLPGEAMTEVSGINYNTCGAHQKNGGQQATWAKKNKKIK